MNLAMLPGPPVWDVESRPSQILVRLHAILSTFRGGGNKQLVELLYKKMAEAQSISGVALGASLKAPTESQFQQSSESSTCRDAFAEESPAESSQEITMSGWFNFEPSYALQEGGVEQTDRSDGCIMADDTITAITSTSDTCSDAWTTESLVITEDIGEVASLFTSLPSWTTPEEELLEECLRDDILTFETSLPSNEDMSFWHAPIIGT